MRTSDAKRNKSCGCLKRDKWHQHQLDRKPKKPIDQLPDSIWSQFDNESDPKSICAKVSALGLYVPQFRRKGVSNTPNRLDETKRDSS